MSRARGRVREGAFGGLVLAGLALATPATSAQDPGTQDPGTQNPGTQNPGSQDPSSQDPSSQDPGSQDPATVEVARPGGSRASDAGPTVMPAAPVGRPPFADATPLESREPVTSVVGTGAPEVLVWFAGPRPGLEELTWRLDLVGVLGERLAPGAGTVHVLTDLGADDRGLEQVYDYLTAHPGVVAVGQVAPVADAAPVAQRRRPAAPAADLASDPDLAADPSRDAALEVSDPAAPAGPAAWIREGLGLPLLDLSPAHPGERGRWLRHPERPGWVWAPFRDGTLGEQRARWAASGADATPFDTDEAWPEDVVAGTDGAVRTLAGPAVRLPGELADAILSALVDPARLGAAVVGAPVRLGGDLWQVDLALAAPVAQVARLDALRTYPAARLVPALSWGGPVEGASIPRLVELAWRAEGAAFFELLPERGPGSGRYGFPGDDLPPGATLRLVVEVPGAVTEGRTLAVALDAGRHGRATVRLQFLGD